MNALVCCPEPNPDARRRLICCGYSGGGTVPFRPWRDVLPSDTELVLLCYPGREGRFAEPLADRWDELFQDAVTAVRTVLDRPYHLFGHSMGGLVAFELTAALERTGARAPDGLIVSSSEAPTNWQEHLQVPPTAHDTDDELTRWLTAADQLPAEIQQEPELLEMALDLMCADLQAAETYRYTPGMVLRTPVEFAYGGDDPDITPAVIERWRALTTGSFTATELPGGHFYTDATWASLPGSLPSLSSVARFEARQCQA
jgi:surfactin synthase thioesterase subunit